MEMDDDKFEKAFADKKHKEVLAILKEIAKAIPEPNIRPVVDAIDRNNKAIHSLATTINEQPSEKEDSGVMDCCLNILSEQKRTNELIKELIKAISSDKKIEFTRNSLGFMNSPIMIKNER